MDWRKFIIDVLSDVTPDRFLRSALAPDDMGFESGLGHENWNAFGRIHVLAAGKPAAAQAGALNAILQGYPEARARLTRAIAVIPEGSEKSSEQVEVVHSAHPVPDQRSLDAGVLIERRLESVGREDLAIFLISGGASSLVESLVSPYGLNDLRELNERMLQSGASISEINEARKQLSALKGGGWVGRCRAKRILNLVSADVPSGDPAIVGSGPGVREPAVTRVICSGRDLLQAAQSRLTQAGVRVADSSRLFDCPIEQAIAESIEDLRKAVRSKSRRPLAIVSGGEAPVRVHGDGRGGRNTEFVLRMAEELWLRSSEFKQSPRITVAAFASDGSDGSTESAGGWLTRAQLEGRETQLVGSLSRNDSLGFLDECKSALRIGPTQVNLMDLRVLLVED